MRIRAILSAAAMLLLPIGAVANVAGGDREYLRTPYPSGCVREAGTEPAECPAGSGCGAYAGEVEPDSAMVVLRRFYTDYITGWLQDGSDRGRIQAILRQYLTPGMFGRLQRMYTELELDYDPFLEAQDCDESVLENFRIERDSVREGIYRVLLWDSYRRAYRKAELLLRPGEGGYRIDGILSLPDCYTRDPE